MHHPRRRNGSKKIPNVKLRPSTSSTREGRARARTPVDEEDGEPEPGHVETQVDIQSGSLPFRGVVACATGDLDKVDLSRRIEQLGGAMSKHLTDDVQYLIADAPGSEKYRFAVKHGLPIMTSNWITDAHERYRNAEDFTLDENVQTIEGYRLPCFAELKICVSGENLLENRHKMARLMHAQGGVYMKDLNELVTHLVICGEAQNMDDDELRTPKLLWALDQNKARQRRRLIQRQRPEERRLSEDSPELMPDIHIVWADWFWDCLKTGGRHPESDYSVERPRPKPRDSLQPMMSTPSFALVTTSTQRQQPTNPALNSDQADEPSTETEIESGVKRTAGAHPGRDDIWSRVKAHAAASSQTHTTATLTLKSKSHADPSESGGGGRSYLDRLHRSRNFTVTERSESDVARSGQSGAPRPFSRVLSSVKVRESSAGPSTPTSAQPKVAKLFSGKTFAILAEAFGDEDAQFRNVIQNYGGEVCTSSTPTTEAEIALQAADFIAVRLMSASRYGARNSPYREKMRTECWIEHCIWAEEIVSAGSHATFKPLTAELPIPGISSFEVAISGLDTLELTFLERFCAVAGLKTEGKFKKATSTHLLCPSKSGDKYKQALLWGKPVVDLDWVYSLGYPDVGAVAQAAEDCHMLDVTNDSPPEGPDADRQEAGKKRTLSAVVDPDSQHGTVTSAPAPLDSPRKRDRKHAIRVEKTASFNNPLETPSPSPRVRQSPRRSSEPTSASMSNTRNRPVLPLNTARGCQDAGAGRQSTRAIPSSQSPSPLRSPAADVVRKQLAVILETDDDDQASISFSPGGELPPVRSRAVSVASSSNAPITGQAAARRKSRPKAIPRHKAIAGELGRSVSMSSVSSTDSRMLKSYSSADDIGLHSVFSQAMASEQDSMRVMYDDPHQRAAKRQLMDLVTPAVEEGNNHPIQIPIPGSETPPSNPGPKRELPTRRSTRTAGF